METKDVKVKVSKSLKLFTVSINDIKWTQTAEKEGVVEGVGIGEGYLSWFAIGNPGDKFEIKLTNAVKATTGGNKISRLIPQGKIMNGRTERIFVK